MADGAKGYNFEEISSQHMLRDISSLPPAYTDILSRGSGGKVVAMPSEMHDVYKSINLSLSLSGLSVVGQPVLALSDPPLKSLSFRAHDSVLSHPPSLLAQSALRSDTTIENRIDKAEYHSSRSGESVAQLMQAPAVHASPAQEMSSGSQVGVVTLAEDDGQDNIDDGGLDIDDIQTDVDEILAPTSEGPSGASGTVAGGSAGDDLLPRRGRGRPKGNGRGRPRGRSRGRGRGRGRGGLVAGIGSDAGGLGSTPYVWAGSNKERGISCPDTPLALEVNRIPRVDVRTWRALDAGWFSRLTGPFAPALPEEPSSEDFPSPGEECEEVAAGLEGGVGQLAKRARLETAGQHVAEDSSVEAGPNSSIVLTPSAAASATIPTPNLGDTFSHRPDAGPALRAVARLVRGTRAAAREAGAIQAEYRSEAPQASVPWMPEAERDRQGGLGDSSVADAGGISKAKSKSTRSATTASTAVLECIAEALGLMQQEPPEGVDDWSHVSPEVRFAGFSPDDPRLQAKVANELQESAHSLAGLARKNEHLLDLILHRAMLESGLTACEQGALAPSARVQASALAARAAIEAAGKRGAGRAEAQMRKVGAVLARGELTWQDSAAAARHTGSGHGYEERALVNAFWGVTGPRCDLSFSTLLGRYRSPHTTWRYGIESDPHLVATGAEFVERMQKLRSDYAAFLHKQGLAAEAAPFIVKIPGLESLSKNVPLSVDARAAADLKLGQSVNPNPSHSSPLLMSIAAGCAETGDDEEQLWKDEEGEEETAQGDGDADEEDEDEGLEEGADDGDDEAEDEERHGEFHEGDCNEDGGQALTKDDEALDLITIDCTDNNADEPSAPRRRGRPPGSGRKPGRPPGNSRGRGRGRGWGGGPSRWADPWRKKASRGRGLGRGGRPRGRGRGRGRERTLGLVDSAQGEEGVQGELGEEGEYGGEGDAPLGTIIIEDDSDDYIDKQHTPAWMLQYQGKMKLLETSVEGGGPGGPGVEEEESSSDEEGDRLGNAAHRPALLPISSARPIVLAADWPMRAWDGISALMDQSQGLQESGRAAASAGDSCLVVVDDVLSDAGGGSEDGDGDASEVSSVDQAKTEAGNMPEGARDELRARQGRKHAKLPGRRKKTQKAGTKITGGSGLQARRFALLQSGIQASQALDAGAGPASVVPLVLVPHNETGPCAPNPWSVSLDGMDDSSPAQLVLPPLPLPAGTGGTGVDSVDYVQECRRYFHSILGKPSKSSDSSWADGPGSVPPAEAYTTRALAEYAGEVRLFGECVPLGTLVQVGLRQSGGGGGGHLAPGTGAGARPAVDGTKLIWVMGRVVGEWRDAGIARRYLRVAVASSPTGGSDASSSHAGWLDAAWIPVAEARILPVNLMA